MHAFTGKVDLAALGRPLPRVQGHEAVGEVEAVGTELRTTTGEAVTPGDRVVYSYFSPCDTCRFCRRGHPRLCADAQPGLRLRHSEWPHFIGAFAEYQYLLPGTMVEKVPEDVTDDQASILNCALSQVLAGLRHARLRRGESVAVIGAGGLGLLTAALAADRGAEVIAVSDIDAERLEVAYAFGATATVDASSWPATDRPAEMLRDATGGGADVVIGVAGASTAASLALEALAPGGRYIEMGNVVPGDPLRIEPHRIVLEGKSMKGMVRYAPQDLTESLATIRMITESQLEQLVGPILPLDRINEAVAHQRTAVCRFGVGPLI